VLSEGGAVSGFDSVLLRICSASFKYVKVYFTFCLYNRKLLGIVSVDFDEVGQILIIYFRFAGYLREKKGIQ